MERTLAESVSVTGMPSRVKRSGGTRGYLRLTRVFRGESKDQRFCRRTSPYVAPKSCDLRAHLTRIIGLVR